MPKILIVCYSFPPNPGVGGRRWAKFVKYLMRGGETPVVISNLPGKSDHSPWTSEIKDAEVHYVSYNYPKSLDFYPKTFLQKIFYRLDFMLVKLKPGNYYDRSMFSKDILIRKISDFIKEKNIKTVVVTCPPFRQAYFVSRLKKDFPDVKLVIDFRDPWTDNTTFLGFNTLSQKRRAYELKLEEEVVRASDKVICVNSYYKELLSKKYPVDKSKFVHIMNGFDMDDIQINSSVVTDEIIITCAGTIYNAVEFLFEPFLNYLDTEAEFLKRAKIKFRIYGNVDENVKKMVAKKDNKFLELFPLLDSIGIHQKIAESSAVMMFIAPNHGDNFNTKFYEYLAHRKPIVLFSNRGEIADFIEANKLGTHVPVTGFRDTLHLALQKISSGTFEMNTKFNLDEFDVLNLKNKLLKIIADD